MALSRAAWLALAGACLAAGCATSPGTRGENEFFLNVYWDAARDCENRHHTLHIARLLLEGDLQLDADQDTRIEFRAYVACYYAGIRERVERRRQAGQPVPENVKLEPPVEIE